MVPSISTPGYASPSSYDEDEDQYEILEGTTSVCGLCKQVFMDLDLWNAHQEFHAHEGQHVCGCGEVFSHPESLKLHQSTHARPDTHSCRQCGENFSALESLRIHELSHSGNKPLKCKKCPESFQYPGELKAHEYMHTEDRSHICDQCGKGFTTAGNLRLHHTTHSTERPYKCEECGKGFARAGHLKEHQLIHVGNWPHTCSDCGKGFSHAGSLKTHQLIHTGERPHVCPQCGKGFTRSAHLTEHQLIHTGAPHICKECGKGFTRATFLQIHMRIHTGEKPFICGTCGKAFSTDNYRATHIRRSHKPSHVGPLKCHVCSKGFTSATKKERHELFHRKGWEHVCLICEEGFATRKYLRSHNRIHSGKPHVCEECDRGFFSPWQLTEHQFTHTGKWPHVCKVCNKGFARLLNLEEHRRAAHNGPEPTSAPGPEAHDESERPSSPEDGHTDPASSSEAENTSKVEPCTEAPAQQYTPTSSEVHAEAAMQSALPQDTRRGEMPYKYAQQTQSYWSYHPSMAPEMHLVDRRMEVHTEARLSGHYPPTTVPVMTLHDVPVNHMGRYPTGVEHGLGRMGMRPSQHPQGYRYMYSGSPMDVCHMNEPMGGYPMGGFPLQEGIMWHRGEGRSSGEDGMARYPSYSSSGSFHGGLEMSLMDELAEQGKQQWPPSRFGPEVTAGGAEVGKPSGQGWMGKEVVDGEDMFRASRAWPEEAGSDEEASSKHHPPAWMRLEDRVEGDERKNMQDDWSPVEMVVGDKL